MIGEPFKTSLDRESYEKLLDTLRNQKRAKTVKVPKEALEKIITDNVRMIGRLNGAGIKVEDIADES